MSNLKTSILVAQQVPEYINDEYPLFISFLEAYYEFMEEAQGNQKNNVLTLSKNMRYVSDVDASIGAFEKSFFNNFASLIPRDVEVNKETLIKNVLPLYISRGNEKSFKLLFRMLFNDEVDVILPKNNVLRISDGKWTVDNLLKLETDIRSTYTGTGSNTTFFLAQQVDPDAVEVYVDDVLKTINTDYTIRKESRKLVFNSAPVSNTAIKVVYDDFDVTQLNNRKITGQTSGATAIIESASKRIITDRLNFGLPFELIIDKKTLSGIFTNGEQVITDIIDPNGTKITLVADTFSILTSILVTGSGASYNVGDTVTILGGGATSAATAEVESVTAGLTNRIVVNYGGAGFSTASLISSSNTPGNSFLTGAVDGVDTSGANTNITFLVNDDIINTYSNITLSAVDYGFPSQVIPAGENINTRIFDALSSLTITNLGPITNAIILFSNTSVNTAILDSQGSLYFLGSTLSDIKSFRAVGRIDVYNGGVNYKVGDEIIFGSNPSGTYGYGAAAAVTEVAGSGTITKIKVQSQRAAGTANISNNSIVVTGTGTSFGAAGEPGVGDKITIRSQERFINAVTSSTTATVNAAFSFSDGTVYSNNSPIGSLSRGVIGGINYTQGSFPTVTVSSSNGSGANIAITSLMGDGENLNALTDTVPGQILRIRVTSGGAGYQYIPQVDLINFGDGSATATAQVGNSYSTLSGRWTTSDSILSSSERKLQGNNYYVDYSYITSSLTEFTKYKDVLRQLLHPSGFVNYADLNKNLTITQKDTAVSRTITNQISGTVSVSNGSIYVTGVNTKFNIANSLGSITLGTNVAVNGELRIVNSIISNTNISVSSAWTMNASAQTLIIVT
jgi:hypothetical protein